jgi:DNA primase
MLSKDEIKARVDLVALIGESVELTKRGHEWVGRCPFHNDSKASLSVNPDKRVWNCFGCGKAGDCIEWIMQLHKVNFVTALAQLQERYGDPAPGNRTITTETVWSITDVDGNVIALHNRYGHPDGTKSYSWNGKDGLGGMKVADLPLYGLKHLFDMGTAAVTSIVVVEGEKAADSLMKTGWAAVGTVTGASSCPNESAFHPLIGFEAKTYLWPDNDDIGRAHMDKVGQHLRTLGMVPYLITWTSAPSHGDAYDYIQQGGAVQVLLDEAVEWTACIGKRAVELERNVIPRSAGTAKGCVGL